MNYVVHDRPDVISESLFNRACDHGFNIANIVEDIWVDIHFIDEKGEGGGTIDTRQEEDAILVEINKHQSVNNILYTLFHEIKHVEQIACGDLKENIYKGEDTKTYEYDARPHEQDAWEFEKIAMITFLELVGEMGNA
jgi:hypothetical protein